MSEAEALGGHCTLSSGAKGSLDAMGSRLAMLIEVYVKGMVAFTVFAY
ncbi:hypothetical protein [Desulfurococcus mucosus]|nr:hypothetical protein [Desulfurococcus mucosus]